MEPDTRGLYTGLDMIHTLMHTLLYKACLIMSRYTHLVHPRPRNALGFLALSS